MNAPKPLLSLLMIGLIAASTSAFVGPRQRIRQLQTPLTGINAISVTTRAAVPRQGVEALDAFQRGSRRSFHSQFDAETGVVRVLAAGQSRSYAGDSAAAARSFVREARPFLGDAANPDTLITALERPTAFGRQVTLQQTVNGVPVVGQAVTVNLSENNEVISAENTTRLLPAINTVPKVTAHEVAARAGVALRGEPQLAVESDGVNTRLVWRYVNAPAVDKVWRVTVDAETGETLRSDNLVMRLDGEGSVYLSNPVVTPTLTKVPFRYLSGNGTLTGTYAKVYKFNGWDDYGNLTGIQDITEPTHKFNYTVGDPKLGQAEVYYGITAIHDYFKNAFGFAGRDHQIPAYARLYANSPGDFANAFYSAGGGVYGIMGFGYTTGTDFALDADVLYHEYTHAVIDKANLAFSDGYGVVEIGGLNEGLADYFSCSLLNSSMVGEYAGRAFGLSAIRDLRNRNHFPEAVPMEWATNDPNVMVYDYPEVHRAGETWGPACWDLRTVLGATVADKIIWKGMTLFSGTTRFQYAVANLLTADAQLYGGANAATIRKVFADRGIADVTAPAEAYPIPYLGGDAFYQPAGKSKVRTGYAYTSGGTFYPDYAGFYESYGLFPSFVVDRWYNLAGYTEDSGVKSAFVVIKDAANKTIAWSGGSVVVLPAVKNGIAATFGSLDNVYFKFPASLIPAGQTARPGLKVYVNCYAQDAATVNNNFLSTSARSTFGGFPAELLVGKLAPVVQPPAFGDTNGDGKATLTDAALVVRSVAGKQTLTTEQKARADVADPKDGNPGLLDAKGILRKSAGLN